MNLLTLLIRDAAGDASSVEKASPYLANSGGVLLGFIWNYLPNSLVIRPHQHREDAAA